MEQVKTLEDLLRLAEQVRTSEDALKVITTLGITLPTPEYIIGAVIFGIIGVLAWFYGKKHSRREVKWIGLALMLYPYVIWQTWLLYAVGGVLCIALFIYRNGPLHPPP